jgi:hypothetical protein
MSGSQNDALAKVPTIEEEVAQFKSFAVKDGENFSGEADEGENAETAEQTVQQNNTRTPKENQGAGRTNTEDKGDKSGKVQLTDDEESDAIQAATDKKGAQLTEEEADEAVGKALSDKERSARKEAHKKDANSRIGELTRRSRSAERELYKERQEKEDLKRRLEALERGERPLTNDTSGNTKAASGGKPDPADAEKYPYGELDSKFVADLARWEVRQELAAEKEATKTQQQSQQDNEAATAFKETVAAFEEAGDELYDDFHEVVMGNLAGKDNPHGWPCSPELGEMILHSDHGPAIAYELALDIKEARKIAALSKVDQVRWFVRKEGELSAGSAASTDNDQDDGELATQAEARTKRQLPQPRTSQVRESKAPPPPSKRVGASGNRVPNAATSDFAAFEAMATGQHK